MLKPRSIFQFAAVVGALTWASGAQANDHYRTWSGFYFGAHIGGNFTDYDVQGTNAFDNGTVVTSYSLDPSAFMGGVQVGYNLQAGQFVLGIEGEYSGANGKDTRNVVVPASGDSRDDFATVKFGSTATLAARLGYTMGSLMPYIKVGGAWAKVNGTAGDTDGNPAVLDPTDATSFSKWQSGWLVGGGLEYMMTRNWTLKGEYQYQDYGSFTTGNLDSANESYRHEFTNQVFKVGINYKF